MKRLRLSSASVLTGCAPFTFLVNAFGSIGAETAASSLGWNYQMDVNPASAEAEEEQSQLYLPFVVR